MNGKTARLLRKTALLLEDSYKDMKERYKDMNINERIEYKKALKSRLGQNEQNITG